MALPAGASSSGEQAGSTLLVGSLALLVPVFLRHTPRHAATAKEAS
jgi:hypothetical protein